MTEFWYTISGALASPPYNDWPVGAGANANVAVQAGGGRAGPATHDDATTYTYGNWASGYTNSCYNVDWPSPMATAPTAASTFTMGIRAGGGGNPNLTIRFYWTKAGPTSGTSIGSYTTSDTTWRTTGPSTCADPATYRPGGGSWDVTDFDDTTSLFPRIWHDTGSGGGNTLLSSIFGQIEYTPPGGGFAFLLGLAGLAALPMLGVMSDYQQFENYLKWREVYHRRHTTWKDEAEKRWAWDCVKNYRYPSFHFMGDSNG